MNLDLELIIFNEYREKWIKQKLVGRWFVIYGKTVLGHWDSLNEAYYQGIQGWEPGSFLVKQLFPRDQGETVRRSWPETELGTSFS